MRSSMPRLVSCLLLFIATLGLPLAAPRPSAAGEGSAQKLIGFESWKPAVFERARRERRILVVSIGTTWCHWCHVMKRETYGHPAIQRRLRKRYVPIYVDADARPDLGERFRNYRWPGTAFFTPDAQPILALRGYRSPEVFQRIMDRVEALVARGGPYPGIDSPAATTAGPSADDRRLDALIERLTQQMNRYYDPAVGGWGRPQKYPVPEPPAWGLWRGVVEGRQSSAYKQTLRTLLAMAPLLDRAWGGVYQYSLEGRWDRWHPEKIMPVNAGALLAWSEAYRLTRDERYRRLADGVVRWLRRFMLAADGSFHASQDADAPRMKGERFYRLTSRQRERYGIPRVDTHRYARDNAMIIRALVAHAQAAERPASLALARRAAEAFWRQAALEQRALKHTLGDSNTDLHLIDHAEMGRAFVALHQATSRPRDLARAQALAATIHERFALPGGGYRDLVTARTTQAMGALASPIRSLEPHASVAHLFLDLYGLTEEPRWLERARATIGAVALPEVTEEHGRYVAGLLHAAERARQPIVRIELLGPAGEHPHAATARRLALEDPRVFWTRRDAAGPPQSLICGGGRCSDPVQQPLLLPAALADFLTAGKEK